MAHDITRFGALRNTVTTSTEHNHIEHAKKNAVTVHKQRIHFDAGVATRHWQAQVIATANRLFSNQIDYLDNDEDVSVDPASPLDDNPMDTPDVILEAYRNSTKLVLKFTLEIFGDSLSQVLVKQEWKTQGQSQLVLSVNVVACMRDHCKVRSILADRDSFKLTVHTEYQCNGMKCRAHPNLPW